MGLGGGAIVKLSIQLGIHLRDNIEQYNIVDNTRDRQSIIQ